MNVLALVTEFCGKKGLPIPSTVVGNTDTNVTQIFYILQETVRELGKYAWNEQKIAKTFTTVATPDQGALTTIIGADFSYLIMATVWDTTLKRPVFGPVSDAMWANLQAFPASGPIYQYKIFGEHLYIYPTPTAGDTIYLIYQSKYGVASAAGTPKEFVTVDTDVFLLPEEVVTRSLDYRWKKQKGESWETDYMEYTDLLGKAMLKTGMSNVHLDGARFKLTPGIWVPAGDWAH